MARRAAGTTSSVHHPADHRHRRKRAADGHGQRALDLVEAETYQTGVVDLTYRQAPN